jgi:hypothetical protein
MHRKSSSPRVWDGREVELSEVVEGRLDALLGSGPRADPRPHCARPEFLLEMMVCRTEVPLEEIAEALGFEDPGDFSFWCERLTGLAPQVLRELGTDRTESERADSVGQIPPGPPFIKGGDRTESEKADFVGQIPPGPPFTKGGDRTVPAAPSPATWCRLVTAPLERWRPADRAALEWFEAKRAAAPRPDGRRPVEDPED